MTAENQAESSLGLSRGAVGTPPESREPAGAIASCLEQNGLIARGRGEDGGLLLVRGRSDRRTTYVHVLSRTNPAWEHYVAFRDYLIAHPDHRDLYAQLKTRLAAAFPADRGAYTKGKAGFIAKTLRLARQAGTSEP